MEPFGTFLVAATIALVFGLLYAGVRRGRRGSTHEGTLSAPANRLLKEYNSLPEESQSFGDITQILVDLDKRSGNVDRINPHFEEGFTGDFTWRCGQGTGCAFEEYHELHRAIQKVEESIKERERALLESNTALPERLAELKQALHKEVDFNTQFVKSLKELK